MIACASSPSKIPCLCSYMVGAVLSMVVGEGGVDDCYCKASHGVPFSTTLDTELPLDADVVLV